MKLLNYVENGQICLGIRTEQGIMPVKSGAADIPASMEQLIKSGESGLIRLAELVQTTDGVIHEEDAVFAPCVTSPEKIICIGVNYKDHGKECSFDIPDHPILFSKFNNALASHKQAIRLPKTAEKFDYEAELVVVIGKKASNVAKSDALSYVFGYTIGNDFSARDLQFRTSQWMLGKTCDQFAPIGPYIVTADEIDPNHLEIRCEVNGEIRQLSNTDHMIFDCAAIISYVSQYITLKPGDIIFTGTPSGVIFGYPENERRWLKSGDRITISVEKLGSLVNTLE